MLPDTVPFTFTVPALQIIFPFTFPFPVISGYVVLSMIILSTGIVLTLMFRKDKITLDDNKKQSKK